MIRRALAAAIALWAIAVGLARAQGPVPLTGYQRTVDQALARVSSAATASPEERATLLAQAADLLAVVSQVEMADGTRLPVDNHALIADLNAAAQGARSREQIQALGERVQALRSALIKLPVAASAVDRGKLRDLLNGPPFQSADAANLWLRLLNAVLDWLDRLMNNVSGGVADQRTTVIALGLVLAAGVVGVFAYSLRRNLAPDARLEAATGQTPTVQSALAQARQSADRGDYRLAARDLYLAALLMLDDHGILAYDPSLTNREVLATVASRPPARTALEPIVMTFDRVWYGQEPMSADEFQAYRRQVDDLGRLE